MSKSAHSPHPEELLDRARRGNLDDSAWRVLRRHVAHCRPCASQLRMAGWLDDSALTNLALTQMRDRTTVSRVLDRLEAAPRARRSRLLLPRFGLVPRTFRVTMVALAFSGAAAATAGSWWGRHPVATQSPAASELAVSTRLTTKRTTPVTLKTPSTAPPDDVSSPAASTPVVTELAHEPSPQPTASTLFSRASELRLAGQNAAAIATFKRLQSLYPHSRESETSHLLIARLYSASAQPELAVLEFGRYLRSGGAAQEEALVGHATALQRLGRATEEAADWQRLLQQFPRSLYGSEAKRRLAALQRPQAKEYPPDSGRR